MKKKYKLEKQYRLPEHDYASDGYYFVTICTRDREEFFGDVKTAIMGLSEIGCIAAKCWQEIPEHFDNVKLDTLQIMPNHLHGVLEIDNGDSSVGTRHGAFLRMNQTDQQTNRFNQFGPLIPKSLSSIINQFKGAVTRFCRNKGYTNFAWQPRFHDRVIRDEEELNRIREYIRDNPAKWWRDRNNPENLWM